VAARSLAVLIAQVLMCAFGLTPGQQHVALGIEIFVLGVVLFTGVMLTTLQTMSAEEPAEDDGEVHEIHLWWKIGHVTIAVQCTVPMIVAGASTWAGVGGGLYWALAEIVCGLIASVTYAWVLLIEILR
jgi:hypothetical protein